MDQHVNPPILMREHIWRFNEAASFGPYVDSYLIVGSEKALLVDTLQTDTGLYEEVRKITDKPLEVFITHGHGDHAGVATREFHEAGVPIYMSHLDVDQLVSRSRYGAQKDWFLDLVPGQIFDLGGFVFHTISIDGHSKGSMVALDYENQLLFSGDGIGSGHFWMQLPNCSPLHVFCENLRALVKECGKCPDLLVFPGHYDQSPVQLTGQFVRDVLETTEGLLDGSLKGEPFHQVLGQRTIDCCQISRGVMVSYLYDPNNF
ncbi:MAG: MBL fold metallo-hydrolase [Clostridiales bacterium]|nr:MBL fold metallo-hydrolase [Clostridiales bacterium]